jgi:YdjC-like protein
MEGDACGSSAAAPAARSSELLGFPPDARVLIVNSDDFLDSFRLDIDTKPARYAALLHNLPPGLTEWAVHPALGNAQSQAVDPDGWRVRWTDYEFLTSPRAKELLQQEGIVVIDYRAIQLAWSQTR